MMTAQNTENDAEVTFEHQDPVKAFAFLWARENAMLTAMTICDDLASQIETEVENDISEGKFGLVYGDWWIPYKTLH